MYKIRNNSAPACLQKHFKPAVNTKYNDSEIQNSKFKIMIQNKRFKIMIQKTISLETLELTYTCEKSFCLQWLYYYYDVLCNMMWQDVKVVEPNE